MSPSGSGTARGGRRGAGAAAATLVALGLAANPAAAQVSASVDADRVGVEDQVQLTLTLEGDASGAEASLPPLDNLRLVGGPSVSTQVSFVNGSVSQSKTLTWVLQPQAEGKARVGAFRVPVGGQEQTTAPIEIEVVAGQVKPAPRRGRRAPFGDPFAGWDPFGDDPFGTRRGEPRRPAKLLLRAEPSRRRLHVGEPLVVSYELYTQTGVSDIQLVDAPQYPGFWSEPLDTPQGRPDGEAATLDGESFRRATILRRLLFPTRAGTLTLPGARFRIGLQRTSLFDPGAGSVERATDPVEIVVDPLPAAADATGAVGRFQVSSSVDRTTLPLGEAATLRFRIEGRGNLKWLEHAPGLDVPGAKVYPPQAKNDFHAEPAGLVGSRTWEYVVVPETAGPVEIPGIPYSYFDPEEKRVVETRTAPIPLQVEGGALAAAPGATGAGTLPGAGRPAPGGLALRADLDRTAEGWTLGPRGVAVALGLALLAHGAMLGGGRLRGLRLRAPGRAAPRHRVREALAALDRAGRGAGSKEASAALIERALHDAFGPLDGDAGGEGERAARRVLEEVQFLRYAPQLGEYSDRIRETAARAAEVVRRWA